MNFNLTVFRKSPATILIALAVVLLFLLAFWFGIAMVPEEKWGQDSNSAIGFAWANMGGLYFGILSPILVAAISATLMGPEQKRGNINWIKSQPNGRKKLLIEKISILFSLALAMGVLQFLITLIYKYMSGYPEEPLSKLLPVYSLWTILGILAVGCFYLWLSTYIDNFAGVLGAAVGLTIATMGISIANQLLAGTNGVEKFLPTSQFIATSFARSPGESSAEAFFLSGVIALLWMFLFVFLTCRKLSKKG